MTSDDADLVAGLLPGLEDFGEEGWRAVPAGAGSGEPADDLLGPLLVARLPEEDVSAAADSPLFLRPPARLAYATAVVLRDDRGAGEAVAVVGTHDFAHRFAAAVAAGVVATPGGAELLGSTTRRIDPGAIPAGTRVTAHRTTFGGATADHVVPVHVDLVVVAAGRSLVVLWLADAPAPYPEAGRRHLLERVGGRLT